MTGLNFFAAKAAMYKTLAENERDGRLKDIYRKLVLTEEKHAAHWGKKLTDAGLPLPPLRLGLRADLRIEAADFEVIVVNDSGQPLPDMDWQHCPRVRVIDTNRRERSVARNTGAAIAQGKSFVCESIEQSIL